ncbi:sensor domain-containing protein [uncultured Thermomonospora sp.]|uniref:sensor histidine kinase n=1 Tax=uncultured Thermomonospora sp. TaxID=671175 RepID=UPI00259B918A|nr:sensor domain-containing protein [uncultured Thermomonospora sp.]
MAAEGPKTAWEALGWRLLLGRWPWRAVAFLGSGAVVAVLAAVPLAVLASPWALAAGRPPTVAGALVVCGGVALAVFGPLVAMPLAELERRRLRLVDARPVRPGHAVPPAAGVAAWLRTRYAEAATWREFGYACLLAVLVPPVYGAVGLAVLLVVMLLAGPLLVAGAEGPVAIGVATVGTVREALPYALAGLAGVPIAGYLLVALAAAHGALARRLLEGRPEQRLRAELVEVSRSRARLVDAFEAERRRIERDLHDGAQQRLLGLTLQLGMALLDLPPGSPAAERVGEAHRQARELMRELREVIRGIHPRVLTDRGLVAALEELADRAALPVTVHAELPGRPPPPVESTAYFVVSEALTNAARHGGATQATVTVAWRDGLLTVEVADDGAGGADPDAGTGLTGLADRVAAVGGRMLLSSPAGGPTVVRVELACELSG